MTAPDDRERLDALGDTQAAADAATRPPAGDPTPPPAAAGLARVGRFSILTRVGAGAMGVVFAAYDELLDRKVAIKLLRGGAGEPDRKARLIREAQALARLSHPNVVAIHESGEHQDQIYIAMEFVRGRTLDGALVDLGADARSRPWKAVVDLFLAAGRGLAAAHTAGLVHRDFKPQNVLVGEDGVVKVADFGLARAAALVELEAPAAADDAGASLLESPLTRVGALVGTPAYMAPEQLEGGPVTPKSDQFAFCVALFEALCGERPYRGDSLAALLDALAAGLPAGERRLGGPAWLEEALRRGLARRPEDRWPTMDALLDALDVDARVRDSDEQRRQLRRVLLTLGPAPLLVWAAIIAFPVADGVYTPTLVLVIWVGMVSLLALLLGVWWRAAFRPGTNRTLSTLMLATLAFNGINRLYGAARDLDVTDILAHDLLFFAAFFAVAALLLSPWLLLAMVAPLAAVVAIAMAPGSAPEIFSSVSLGLVPLVYLCVRRTRPTATAR